MPDGELHPISRKIRRPRGFIPVRVLKKEDIPKELRDMMGRSRAEISAVGPHRLQGVG
jgi:hypothetical protein